MTAVFPAPAARKPFDGKVLLQADGGSTVWGFPFSTVSIGDTDNIGRPDTIDGGGNIHIEAPGVRMGTLDFVTPFMPDRAVNTFLTAAAGARTGGQLTPFVANIVPYNGGGVQKMTGIWVSRVSIVGRFAVPGMQSMVQLRISALVFDIDNYYSAPTLMAPGTTGLNGAGAASFAAISFTDGQASPATYDGIRSFSWTADNGLTPDPSIIVPASRICGGAVPSSLRGAITLEQLSNPTNPLPSVRGNYGLAITIPTGDETHSMVLTSSMSRDGSALNMVPTDFIGRGQLYALFGTTSTPATTTAAHPFAASYA